MDKPRPVRPARASCRAAAPRPTPAPQSARRSPWCARFPIIVFAAICVCGAATLSSPPAGAAFFGEVECVPIHLRGLHAAELDGRPGLELLGASGAEVQIRAYAGARSFAEPVTVTFGSTVLRLLSADVSGDGRADLVAYTDGPPTLRARVQLGALAFDAERACAVPAGLLGLAAGDLNRDGRADLVACYPDSVVVVLAREGGVPEIAGVVRGTPHEYAWYPEIADLDGDAFPDLIVPGADGAEWRVAWLRGHGDGSFASPVTIATARSGGLVARPADLDRDGDLDLVYAAYGDEGRNDVRWIRNDGVAGFSEGDTLVRGSLSGYEQYPSCGDVDADGWPDVILYSRLRHGYEYECVTVVFAAGDAGRRTQVTWHLAQQDFHPGAVDLDQDGWPEILTRDSRGFESGAGILWGAGDGALLGRGAIPGWARVGVDWGGGGVVTVRPGPGRLPDLVAAPMGRMRLLRNRGNGTFLSADEFARGTVAAAGDLDGNGIDEVIVTRGDTVQVYRRATSAGPFIPQGLPFVGEGFGGLSDVDADGHLDLVLDSGHSLTIRRGDGGGGFGSPSPLVSFPVAHGALLFRDLDANGAPELVWADASALRVGSHEDGDVRVALHVQRNDGHGGLAPAATDTLRFAGHHGLATLGSRLDAGDVDGDGDPDVVLSMGIGGSHTNWFGAFLNDGTGRLVASLSAYPAGTPGGFMNVRDLDRDGMADVILHDSDGYDFDMRVAPAIGGGAFGPIQWFESATSCGGMVAEDLDGDGLCDVAAVDGEMGGLIIHRNVTPAPPPTPALAAFSAARLEDGAVTLEWITPGGSGLTLVIERALDDGPWEMLASAASNGTGHGVFRDANLVPGRRHGYRLRFPDGVERTSPETWIEVPLARLALEGPRPNPVSPRPVFVVTLPARGDAALEIFDVAGRRVRHQRLGELPAGSSSIRLDGAPLLPGLYVARLQFGPYEVTRRFVSVR